MSKIRLVNLGWTTLDSYYITDVLRKSFDIELYNESNTYNKKDCIFVASQPMFTNIPLIFRILSQGYKLIISNQWEISAWFQSEMFETYLDNILLIVGSDKPAHQGWKHVLAVPLWFWYNESLWYTCESKMQYQNYVPTRTNNKLFFMPINRVKQFRTDIVNCLDEFLNDAIWSYVGDNSQPQLITRKDNPVAQIDWCRQFEERWYNDTYFSVAVESLEKSDICKLFVTEKTFKPIAFQHPFIICGMSGTLKFLKDHGFETYDHIFDESYDMLDNFDDRLNVVYNNIKEFDTSRYANPLTEQKIKHNYERFYNKSVVESGFKSDIIEPILRWMHEH